MHTQMTKTSTACSSRVESDFCYNHLQGPLQPLSLRVQLPTLKEIEQYPVLLDPRDNSCLDKMFTRLGPKYTNVLITLDKAKNWGNNPYTTLSYVRQLMRQIYNPNLTSEQIKLIQRILENH